MGYPTPGSNPGMAATVWAILCFGGAMLGLVGFGIFVYLHLK